MLGREGEREASRWSSVEPGSCFSRYVGGMIIEDQLDRGAGRISGVETLEEFDELSATVAVSDERINLPGKQVDSGQQAKRAMTFVLVIPREGRVDAGLGRQIGCRRCDRLDSRLCATWRQPFSGPGPRGRRTEPPPSSAQIRHRDVPDSSDPCAA